MKRFTWLFALFAVYLNVQTAAAAETITVVATKYPNGEILEHAVKPILAKQGYDLKVINYQSYHDERVTSYSRIVNRPCPWSRENPDFAVLDDRADANFFQHPVYLQQFNEDYSNKLQSVEGVFYVPYAIYASSGTESDFIKSRNIKDIMVGSTVYIPGDAMNEERALLFLQNQGLIKLENNKGYIDVNKIVANPYQLKIQPMDAVLLPRMFKERQSDIVVMNAGQAANHGIPFSQMVVAEDIDHEYENILVARKDKVDSPKIKALAEALHSAAVKTYIQKTYHGEVVPLF